MSEAPYSPSQAIVRSGARLPSSMRENPDAVVRAYWDAIKTNGMAADVIAAASDPSNPMHDYFTWDDLEAADKERLREAFTLGSCFADAKTGEPIFVSTYRQTNNIADAGRIHVNVRLLPPAEKPIEKPQRVYTIGSVQQAPAPAPEPAPVSPAPPYTMHAAIAEQISTEPAPPKSEVVEDPSLGVFVRWVESHKHNRTLLREAWRILRDAL